MFVLTRSQEPKNQARQQKSNMGKAVTSFAQLETECQKKMRNAMERTVVEGWMKARENAEDFYSQDSPKRRYDRTGTYGDAPDADDVSGSGNSLHARIYMNPNGHGYRTGTFSAQEVWEAAEDGAYGVLGKPGRWAQTEEDVKTIGNREFSKEFGR